MRCKVRYMAPEQLSGNTRSPTIDLYAVGALLRELLDGKKFRGIYEDGQQLFTAVLSGEIPPLSRPAPPELDQLRLALLAPDPADRIRTAEEAISRLKRYPDYGDARRECSNEELLDKIRIELPAVLEQLEVEADVVEVVEPAEAGPAEQPKGDLRLPGGTQATQTRARRRDRRGSNGARGRGDRRKSFHGGA